MNDITIISINYCISSKYTLKFILNRETEEKAFKFVESSFQSLLPLYKIHLFPMKEFIDLKCGDC